MPIHWTVNELCAGTAEFPDVFLVSGTLSGGEDRRLWLCDRELPEVRAPIADVQLLDAVQRDWWPFRDDVHFMLRCQVRRALGSIELDLIEEIAFMFPRRHDSWISLDWDAP